MNKYNFLYTTTATKDGETREVQITDNTKESALSRMRKQNIYWEFNSKLKEHKINKKDETFYV